LVPVEVSSLKKSYGDLRAVDDVSFSVNQGEVFALLGPNGAGKTTIIEILEGLRKRDAGDVKILGLDPWKNGYALHREIGIIPQGFTFFDKQNPREAVKYYAQLFGVSVDADEILKEVMLEDSADVLFENLSGGQRQKLGLALSLVNSPGILFLDEPTTGLDWQGTQRMMFLIHELHARNHTIIIITHDMQLAAEHAGRIVVMNAGCVVADGPPAAVFKETTTITDASLALPPMAELANMLVNGQEPLPAVSVEQMLSLLSPATPEGDRHAH